MWVGTASPSYFYSSAPPNSTTDCYLFIEWLKVNQKKKINAFMFCDSEALQCCREWKHLFFLTPQYSNMFHSIREWKLEAWKCKELDNSPPKPLRYIKKRWLAKLSQLRACSACEEGFVVASTLTQHVTAHRLSPVHISSCNLWVLDGGCSRWVVFKDHPWHFPLNEWSFWYSQSEVRLGDLNSSCPFL